MGKRAVEYSTPAPFPPPRPLFSLNGVAVGFPSRFVRRRPVNGIPLVNFRSSYAARMQVKFWQTRWEQRLLEFEREHMPGLEFFGASPERIRADVEKGLAFHELRWTQRLVYSLALNKPSVSYSMIRLSALFVIGWLAFIAISIVLGKSPIG